MAKFSSRVVRSTSSTWKPALATSATVGVPASTRRRRFASSSARARAACAAERREPRPSQRLLPERGEERIVLRVRPGPAALDPVEAELVEPPREVELVLERQRGARALTAVAQRRVVDPDLLAHVAAASACGRGGGFNSRALRVVPVLPEVPAERAEDDPREHEREDDDV